MKYTDVRNKIIKTENLAIGAMSNQVITCAIFSNNNRKAYEKLKEISKEKQDKGIKIVSRSMTLTGNIIIFEDGEEWRILSVHSSIRGYRWRKAWVDNTIPQTVINDFIDPIGNLYKWEDYKLF